MVRNYKRKTNQQSWSALSMQKALEKILKGDLSIKEASKAYNVPYSTLYRKQKTGKSPQEAAVKSLGRFKKVFDYNHETLLKNHILLMEKRLFSLTILDLRLLAYQYAIKNNLSHCFNNQKEIAGRDWVYNFMKRNPELSLRQPEKTSAARASAFNRTNVSKFFDLLGELMCKYNFTASRIYNCDETGMTTVPNKPAKIISLKGKKQVGSLSSSERGTLVTAEICMNAAGQYIPPLLIFPRTRSQDTFSSGLPPDSIVVCHPSGWMQTEIFSPTWLNHFIKYVKPTAEDPVLLVCDGHSTHVKNIDFVTRAKDNFIHVLILPPHTSHRLQPLDVSFMFPLSAYYEQEVKRWLKNHSGKIVTIKQVGELFGLAYQRAATIQTAVNGFKTTGICPYNPYIFPNDLFEPSETTNKTLVDNQTTIKQTPTTSYQTISTEHVSVTPEDIMPVPHVGSRTIEEASAPKRKKGKTMIITDTPNLKELENNLPVINNQKKKVVKKRLFMSKAKISKPRSISSSEDDFELLNDTSDNNRNIGADENNQIKKTLNLTGKYIVAKFQVDKTLKHFVGIVLNSNNDVKFLRKYKSKFENSNKILFIWPNVEDIYNVKSDDVCIILPKPTEDRRGRLTFKGGLTDKFNIC